MAKCAFDAPRNHAVEIRDGTYHFRAWEPGEKEKYQQEVLGHVGVYDKWLKAKERQAAAKTLVRFSKADREALEALLEKEEE